MNKPTHLSVSFDGILTIALEDAVFLNVADPRVIKEISGEEWIELSEEEQDDYVLNDLFLTMRDSDSLDYQSDYWVTE